MNIHKVSNHWHQKVILQIINYHIHHQWWIEINDSLTFNKHLFYFWYFFQTKVYPYSKESHYLLKLLTPIMNGLHHQIKKGASIGFCSVRGAVTGLVDIMCIDNEPLEQSCIRGYLSRLFYIFSIIREFKNLVIRNIYLPSKYLLLILLILPILVSNFRTRDPPIL